MEDQTSLSGLVDALNAIRDELRQINRNMAQMAAAAPTSSQSAPSFQNNGRGAVGVPFRGKPAFRKPSGMSGGYKRPDAGPDGGSPEEGSSFRFAKKPSFGRGPARPKGKLPPKKGGGYPKKSH